MQGKHPVEQIEEDYPVVPGPPIIKVFSASNSVLQLNPKFSS